MMWTTWDTAIYLNLWLIVAVKIPLLAIENVDNYFAIKLR